jgi:hypothetical protein
VIETKLRASLGEIDKGLRYIRSSEAQRSHASNSAIERCLQAVESAVAQGEWRATRFNIFDILSVRRMEKPHSTILAWLLDPDGAHGFGDLLLRHFLAVTRCERQFDEVTVTPEWKCGDGYVDIHVQGTGWALFIENKVDALESTDQTRRYARWMRPDDRGVFLTVTGEPASSPRFRAIRYREVRRMLEKVSGAGEASIVTRHLIEHIFADLEK